MVVFEIVKTLPKVLFRGGTRTRSHSRYQIIIDGMNKKVKC